MAPPTRTSTGGPTQAQIIRSDAMTDFQARRLQRRLEEFERTNPTDIPPSSFVPGQNAKGSQSQSQVQQAEQNKKKQSANVRKVLYARKSLKDWLEELPREPKPPYLSAVARPPSAPPRKICSSCGYVGVYRCPRCAEWSCDMNCMAVHERDGGCGVGG